MGTVCAAAHLGGALHLNVEHFECVRFEALGQSVRVSVLKNLSDKLNGLLGPATLCHTTLVLFALGLAPDIALEATVRDNLFVFGTVGKISKRLLDLHALDSHRSLA